ncbi:MAG: DUF1559 domain-containing protein [Planctomycetota bacterium]
MTRFALRKRFSVAILMTLVFLPACGSSKKEDLLAQMSKRRRTDKKPSETVAAPPPASEAAVTTKPEPIQQPEPVEEEVKSQSTMVVKADEEETATLTERVGFLPINDPERMKQFQGTKSSGIAATNMTKLGYAFAEYFSEMNNTPRPAIKTRSGIDALSWRVELLPYLGYQELYDEFDLDRPWDMPPNRNLLAYIPNEYVSPERLDTNTNLLGVSSANGLFEEGGLDESDITDSLDCTLAVVEVNNELAVPWTKPGDYGPDWRNFKSGIGALRGDGTFAIWGNGMATLIPTNVDLKLLGKAVRYGDGDRSVAGKMHKSISGYVQTEDVFVAKTENPDLEPTREMEATVVPEDVPVRQSGMLILDNEPMEQTVPERSMVPSGSSLTAASVQAEKLLRGELAKATRASSKAELAKRIIESLPKLGEDLVGRYAMLDVAKTLAFASRDLEISSTVVDELIAEYELDAMALNAELLELASAPDVRISSTAAAASDVRRRTKKRALLLCNQAVRKDDYDQALVAARVLVKLADGRESRDIKYAAGRLSSSILACKRKFEEMLPVFRDMGSGYRSVDDVYALGIFYCFFKGDWSAGLPLLDEAEREPLAGIARKDNSGVTQIDDAVELGDRWMQAGDRAKGIYRSGARSRALWWYEQAARAMEGGLAQVYLNSQIAQLEKESAAAPIALIQDLGDLLGVRPDTHPVLFAQGAATRPATPNFDDDDE